MKKTFNTLNIVTTAMLCAMGVIIASSLHSLGGQEIATSLSPMHLPVFLAGILCGPWLGLICGVLSPLMSFLTTGGLRPPFPNQLIPMIVELAVYGFLSGLLRHIFLKNPKTNKFSSVLALAISMVAGRIPAAFVSAIFAATEGAAYFAALGASLLGKFTSTWIGMLVQLALIPSIMFALQRSGVLLKYLPAVSDKQSAEQPAEDQEQPSEQPTDE